MWRISRWLLLLEIEFIFELFIITTAFFKSARICPLETLRVQNNILYFPKAPYQQLPREKGLNNRAPISKNNKVCSIQSMSFKPVLTTRSSRLGQGVSCSRQLSVEHYKRRKRTDNQGLCGLTCSCAVPSSLKSARSFKRQISKLQGNNRK